MLEQDGLRIAVLQPGARLHYAVPTLLQRAGMLQCLYTDFANTGLLRYLEFVWPRSLQPASVRRLFGRKLPGEIPASKIRQARSAAVHDELRAIVGKRRDRQSSQALMRCAVSQRFSGANAIYTVLVNEDLETCRTAKAQGCRIIHEVMLTPEVGLLTYDEYRRYAGTAPEMVLRDIEAGRERDRQKYSLADLILVPSDFVRKGVLALGADPSKIATVPYGIDRHWLDVPSHPVRGRVLFVGSVGLRKGSHYLAEAARRLAERNFDCRVCVVGPYENGISPGDVFTGPTYLGQIPRAEIHRQYSAADLFVLPSLAEGMAMVTLEAMAVGLPVITTPNSGSCVRDGIDGIIVPPCDPSALVSAIERIVGDRTLREAMSRNAKARAAEFTWDKYESRLIGALGKLSSSPSVRKVSTLMTAGKA